MSELQRENEEINKKDFWERNVTLQSIFIALLTAVVTALLTQGLSDYYWKQQFDRTNNKKLIEYKTSSLEKYVTGAYKEIYLSEFAYRIKIELFLDGCRYKDSIKKASNKDIAEIPTDYYYLMQKKEKEKDPLKYSNYMDFLAFQHEYLASAAIVRTQFSKGIADKIMILSNSIANERPLIDSLQLEAINKKITNYEVNKDNLVNHLREINSRYLSLLVDEMIKEVKMENN